MAGEGESKPRASELEVESRDSREKLLKKYGDWLYDMAIFTDQFYEQVRDLVSKLSRRDLEKEPLTPAEETEIDESIKIVKAVKVLDLENYQSVLKDGKIGKFISHDMEVISGGMFGRIKMLGKNKISDVANLKRILDNWYYFAYMMKACLSKYKDTKKVETKLVRPFDPAVILGIVEQFRNSGAVSGKVRKMLRVECPSAESLLKKDEDVKVAPAIITYSLLNIIRNACQVTAMSEFKTDVATALGEQSKGSGEDMAVWAEKQEQKLVDEERANLGKVVFKFFRDEQRRELVFQVMDLGPGMPKRYLDSKSRSFIFRSGVSHRDKTELEKGNEHGLGLADMHHAMKSMRVVLSVLTRDSETDTPVFYTNLSDRRNRESMAAEVATNNFVTVFELRVPINKRTVVK